MILHVFLTPVPLRIGIVLHHWCLIKLQQRLCVFCFVLLCLFFFYGSWIWYISEKCSFAFLNFILGSRNKLTDPGMCSLIFQNMIYIDKISHVLKWKKSCVCVERQGGKGQFLHLLRSHPFSPHSSTSLSSGRRARRGALLTVVIISLEVI